jgi:hypothetical protein
MVDASSFGSSLPFWLVDAEPAWVVFLSRDWMYP